MGTEFNLEAIEKTFTKYRTNEMVEGVIVAVAENGVIFNLGGKLDAFISKDEMNDFANVKIGDRFPAVILGGKNEDGMILASKKLAEDIKLGNQNAENIKLGTSFTCVITGVSESGGLKSKLGQYSIYVPEDEVCSYRQVNPKAYISKRVTAIATEINTEEKSIIASIKILDDKTREENETNFWRSNFVNKIVDGTVKRFVPYGAFVEVGGVDCLLHISDVSYDKIQSASEILEIGKTYKFKILSLDRESHRVSLGYKQLQESKKLALLKSMKIGERYDGVAVKMLPFGAIIRLENGVEGLLHVKNATEDTRKQIYEIIKLDQKINVWVKGIDLDRERLDLAL